MTTTNTIDSAILARIKKSPFYQQLEEEEDAARVQAHQQAVDVLLEHQATAAAQVQQAQEAVEQALTKLRPLEERYKAASQELAEARTNARSTTYLAEQAEGRLQREVQDRLPPIIHLLGDALRHVEREIRNALNVTESRINTLSGSRAIVDDNTDQLQPALARVAAIRAILAELILDPRPLSVIVATLKTEVAQLVQAAKAAGVLVGHHMPTELLDAPAEQPERPRGLPTVIPGGMK